MKNCENTTANKHEKKTQKKAKSGLGQAGLESLLCQADSKGGKNNRLDAL